MLFELADAPFELLDGRADPNNVFDAAVGTGRYLCAGGLDADGCRANAFAITFAGRIVPTNGS